VRVLVIEDNQAIATHLAHGLKDEGYEPEIAATAAEGEIKAKSQAWDAIVLDVMLPDSDGITLCGRLRAGGLRTPILIVTALGASKDKIRALDAGADDYIVKPVHLGELFARLRAICRRGEPSHGAVLRYADVELNLSARHARRAQKTVQLRPKELALLEYLLKNPERALSRAELGERVWDVSFDPESNVIEVYISNLRKKLGDPALIHTVSGVGYRLGPI
jgi:DNA-binding response OmpR family regulator